MANIIRATTPTLKYTFRIINVSDIVSAYLTIKQDDRTIIEKSLQDATVGENSLSWMFTQQETLLMAMGKISAMLNWKLSDGTRGASRESLVSIMRNHKEEVI